MAFLQFQAHCEEGHLFRDKQSGFRPPRGTELTILTTRERFLTIWEAGRPSALVLLDLSAALNTVDHAILMEILDDVFGVKGKAWD